MKKRLFAIVAVIMSLFLGVSIFSGCNLLTKNTEKDMAQTVATVQIDEDAPRDKISKQQVMMAYLNYGYYYVAQGSYTQEQAINMMVDNLITTRILVQNAMAEFDADQTYPTKNEGKGVWDVERYLTVKEMTSAKYTASKAINDLIDSYEEKDDTAYNKDTLADEVRAVPTGATNFEEEITDADKQEYVAKNDGVRYFEGIDIGEKSTARRTAYNKVLKLLENNGLLGDYDGANVKTTAYYKEALKNATESELIEIFETRTKESIRKAVAFSTLEEKYVEMYTAQKNLSSADYNTALDAATKDNPMIYHPAVGYGYVYNLLLGVDDVQKELIGDMDNPALRRQILSSTTVKDLRSTWILNGYDFDLASKKFTGDYAHLEDSLPFYGDVTLLKEKTDEYSAEYRIDGVTEFGLDAFVQLMEEYLYGAVKTGEDLTGKDLSYYKIVNNNRQKPANYVEKINELLFAFSTDPGSLNTYKGYKISPVPDLGEEETYMQEFADAGRELLKMGDGSYIMVATNYGYHVMFFSQVLSSADNYDNLIDYLASLDGSVSDWAEKFNDMIDNWEDYEDTDSYLYVLADLVINEENAMSKKQEEIVKKYKNDNSKVKKYADRYADLIV